MAYGALIDLTKCLDASLHADLRVTAKSQNIQGAAWMKSKLPLGSHVDAVGAYMTAARQYNFAASYLWRGVRPGDTLPPLLFDIFIDVLFDGLPRVPYPASTGKPLVSRLAHGELLPFQGLCWQRQRLLAMPVAFCLERARCRAIECRPSLCMLW